MFGPRTNLKLCLISPCGWGNLGDAAIQTAVIKNIRTYRPDAEIRIFTLNPMDTEQRHNVPCYPIAAVPRRGYWVASQSFRVSGDQGKCRQRARQKTSLLWQTKRLLKNVPIVYPVLKTIYSRIASVRDDAFHWIRSYKMLKDIEFLIISGGGQLDDYWGGPWGHPYSLFKWALLARVTNTKLIVLSVGVGTIDSLLSRFFLRTTLWLAEYRSYRDETSKRLVEALGIKNEDPVFPDLAFSIPLCQYKLPDITNKDRIVVGVSPIAYFDPRSWPEKDVSVYCDYTRRLAEFVCWLLRQGYPVVMFATDSPDLSVVEDIRKIVAVDLPDRLAANLIEANVKTVDDLFVALSGINLVVASRLHGVLLSYVAGKPVLAISYDKKVDALVEEMNQKDYCVDIRTFDLENLKQRFNRLQSEIEKTHQSIVHSTSQFRQRLREQYERLLN